MKYSLIIFIFTILSFASLDLQAQNSGRPPQYGSGIIHGYVLDSSAKIGLAYSTVKVLNPKDSSIVSGGLTNNNGEFLIEHLPNGTYLLNISFIGYNKLVIKNVPISKDAPRVELDTLYLSPNSVNKNEVSVVADKDIVTYKIDKKNN